MKVPYDAWKALLLSGDGNHYTSALFYISEDEARRDNPSQFIRLIKEHPPVKIEREVRPQVSGKKRSA